MLTHIPFSVFTSPKQNDFRMKTPQVLHSIPPAIPNKSNCTNKREKKKQQQKTPGKFTEYIVVLLSKENFSQETQTELQLRKIKPLILRNNLHLEKNSRWWFSLHVDFRPNLFILIWLESGYNRLLACATSPPSSQQDPVTRCFWCLRNYATLDGLHANPTIRFGIFIRFRCAPSMARHKSVRTLTGSVRASTRSNLRSP